jgi:hypothetical protein
VAVEAVHMHTPEEAVLAATGLQLEQAEVAVQPKVILN